MEQFAVKHVFTVGDNTMHATREQLVIFYRQLSSFLELDPKTKSKIKTDILDALVILSEVDKRKMEVQGIGGRRVVWEINERQLTAIAQALQGALPSGDD